VSTIINALVEDPANSRHALVAYTFFVHIAGRLFFYWSMFRIKQDDDGAEDGDAVHLNAQYNKGSPGLKNMPAPGFMRANSERRRSSTRDRRYSGKNDGGPAGTTSVRAPVPSVRRSDLNGNDRL